MKREALTTGLHKLHALAELLEIPFSHAVGLVVLLWKLTEQSTPQGDIGKLSNRAIAHEIDWRGAPDALISALLHPSVALLDADEEHRLLVHDWPEHCESFVHKKLARAGLRFADGTKPNVNRLTEAEREAADSTFKRGLPLGAHRAPRVRPMGDQGAPNERPKCAPRAPKVRPMPMPLPMPTAACEAAAVLPTAAAAVFESRPDDETDETDRPASDSDDAPCPELAVGTALNEALAVVVETLYPSRPWSHNARPDPEALRHAIAGLQPPAPLPLETFAGRLWQWSVSDDWRENGGQFIPAAEVFISKRRWFYPPRKCSVADVDLGGVMRGEAVAVALRSAGAALNAEEQEFVESVPREAHA